jgi:hypothetical protein
MISGEIPLALSSTNSSSSTDAVVGVPSSPDRLVVEVENFFAGGAGGFLRRSGGVEAADLGSE